MALIDKNIVITPSIGAATDPKIVFSAADASTSAQNITLTAYPTTNGTLSFDGSAGQLFSIVNSLSGTIFSVNDISGIPSIEVLDSGIIKLAQYSGSVGIGTSNPVYKLDVTGTLRATGAITLNSGNNSTAIINGGTAALGNIGASGQAFNYGYFTNLVGTIQTIAQTNITSVGNLLSLSSNGTIQTTGIVYANSGVVSTSTTTGALVVIGGVGISGNVYNSGIHSVNSLNYLTAIANGGTSGTGNIGATGAVFNTVFAKATTAQYADLAENYSTDANYRPGTVVIFDGVSEITISSKSHDFRIAGVISTNPAYHMNSSAEGLPVALTGRVPCQVHGPIKKGDLVVSSDIPGVGQRIDNAKYVVGCVIGKSLENILTDEIKVIEVVVGRV
jgi:hypothetical protein